MIDTRKFSRKTGTVEKEDRKLINERIDEYRRVCEKRVSQVTKNFITEIEETFKVDFNEIIGEINSNRRVAKANVAFLLEFKPEAFEFKDKEDLKKACSIYMRCRERSRVHRRRFAPS